jgi:hypothetical protein
MFNGGDDSPQGSAETMSDLPQALGLKREAVQQEIDGPTHIDNPLQIHLRRFCWRFVLNGSSERGIQAQRDKA